MACMNLSDMGSCESPASSGKSNEGAFASPTKSSDKNELNGAEVDTDSNDIDIYEELDVSHISHDVSKLCLNESFTNGENDCSSNGSHNNGIEMVNVDEVSTESIVNNTTAAAAADNMESDPIEVSEEVVAVIDELKKSLYGLSWNNIFPSVNIDDMTKSEIEDLIACAEAETLQKYYARSQTINGSENMESILRFLEFFEMACVHIDPKVQRDPEVEKLIQKCRDRHVPVLMLPHLSRIVSDEDYLSESNCNILGFKKCIKNRQSCFKKLYTLSRKATKNRVKQKPQPPDIPEPSPTRNTKIRKNAHVRKDEGGIPKQVQLPQQLHRLLPIIHPAAYSALTKLLKASLYGLRYKDGFKPRNLYYKCQNQEENFFTWCRKNYPQTYPVVEARSHLKIADTGGEKTVMKDIYSNKIILLYIKVPPSEAFPLKKIVLACYNKSIPILPIEDFSGILGDPSTLFLPDCPALGLRESVLNRKSGYYGLYKMSCEAIGKIARPEFPYDHFNREWEAYLRMHQPCY